MIDHFSREFFYCWRESDFTPNVFNVKWMKKKCYEHKLYPNDVCDHSTQTSDGINEIKNRQIGVRFFSNEWRKKFIDFSWCRNFRLESLYWVYMFKVKLMKDYRTGVVTHPNGIHFTSTYMTDWIYEIKSREKFLVFNIEVRRQRMW